MENVLVSICIPAYNASQFIEETLNTVFEQTHKNWELIVVEDGSLDGTKEIVEDFAKKADQKIYYYRNSINLGLSETRNIAASHATGEWIAFLDSDDLWLNDHLANLIETSINLPLCDIIHSGTDAFDSDSGKIIFQQSIPQDVIEKFPLSIFNRSYGIQPSSIMVSKKLLETTGGFNITYRYVEDLEMWLRCAMLGFKFAYTKKNTCLYRKNVTNALTSHTIEMAYYVARVYEDNISWEIIPKDLRYQKASEGWFNVARMARSSNKKLATQSLAKSMKYAYNLKKICYWILLKIS